MQLSSRGYATDIMLASFDGEVAHGDGYIAVRTPSCPAFWWGNFVLFSEPPRSGVRQAWEAVFDRELAAVAGVEHRNFAWDTTHGELGAASTFVAAGYKLNEAIFLSTKQARKSPHHRVDVNVRPIDGDSEWCQVLELQHQSLDPLRDTPSFRSFQSSQMLRNRRLSERGLGKWFGAFSNGELVATMGLYVQNGLARCQFVATSPRYRRMGYCSTLVQAVCEHGLKEMGATEIVIMTDAGNPAQRVYRAVGFGSDERVASLSMATPRQPGTVSG